MSTTTDPWGRTVKAKSEEFEAQPEYIWLRKDDRAGIKSHKPEKTASSRLNVEIRGTRHSLQLIESRSCYQGALVSAAGSRRLSRSSELDLREGKQPRTNTQADQIMPWFDLVLGRYIVKEAYRRWCVIPRIPRWPCYGSRTFFKRQEIHLVCCSAWWEGRSLLQPFKI